MKKVFYYTPLLEHPPSSGGLISVYNHIKALSIISNLYVLYDYSRFGRQKTTLSYYKKKKFIFISKKFKNLNLTANFILNYCHSNKINILWIDRAAEYSFDLVNCLRSKNKEIKIISSTDSVFSEFLFRRAKIEKKLFTKFLYYLLALKRYFKENLLLKNSTILTSVSNRDKKIYQSKYFTKCNIKLFSNVVDLNNYKRKEMYANLSKKNYLYFSGWFGKGGASEKGADWFINNVLIKLKKKIPNIKLLLAGKEADKSFKNSKNIIVIGKRKSLNKYLQNANIVIVPIFYESGTRFKILEAGACKKLVISTSLGAEGIKYKKNYDIVIANNTQEFEKSITKFYKNNSKLKNKISKNLYFNINKNYSLNIIIREARQILKKL